MRNMDGWPRFVGSDVDLDRPNLGLLRTPLIQIFMSDKLWFIFILGYYKCLASSPVGEDEQTVFVNILKPPEVTTEQQDEVAAVRGSVDLVCLVKANPTAEIHWEHKGRIITGSARTRPRIDQNGNSVLRIRDINLEDQGEGHPRAALESKK